MESILDELGIRDLIGIFRQNMVGPEEVLSLTDEEFKSLGITTIGDRARLRSRCRMQVNGTSFSESPAIKKYKELTESQQKKKKKKDKKNETAPIQTTRRIRLGWRHRRRTDLAFSTVSGAKGGGSEVVDIDKKSDLQDVREKAMELYFPNGIAKLNGNIQASNCELNLGLFNGTGLPKQLDNGKNFTVEDFYLQHNSSPLRLYLYTTLIEIDNNSVGQCTPAMQINDSESGDDLPDPALNTRGTEIDNDDTATKEDSVTYILIDEATTTTNDTSVDEDTTSSGSFLDPPTSSWTETPTVTFNRHKLRLNNVKKKELAFEVEQEEENLQLILTRLYSKVNLEAKKNIINVDRYNILDGGKRGFNRKSFNTIAELSVRFSGEAAIDDGGPRREFARLSLMAIKDSPIFEGPPNSKILCPNVKSEDSFDYYMIGRMIAYFLVHRSPAPKFFSSLMYDILAYGCESCTPTVADIVDTEMKEKVQKIGESQDHITFWSAVEAVMPVIEFIGAIPLASKYENKEQLVHVLVQHLVVKRIQDVLAQFIEGFECLGCFKEVTSNPKTMKQLFVCDNSVILNSVMVDELFKVNFSQEGSNHYILELKTHTYWRDFVQDLEEEPEGLQNLLTFITGYDTVPPLGFDPPLSLHFIHTENDSDDDAVPYANTCANMLQIPVLSSFDVFQERMHLAVKLGTTFTNQ